MVFLVSPGNTENLFYNFFLGLIFKLLDQKNLFFGPYSFGMDSANMQQIKKIMVISRSAQLVLNVVKSAQNQPKIRLF